MNAPTPQRITKGQSFADLETNDAEGLLRLLVTTLRRDASPETMRNVDGISELLLGTQMDGVRYVLMRSEQLQVKISPRERLIARMVADGHPNKTIAATLDISTWTVSTYLRRVFAKLGVGSRAAMVARLITSGALIEDLDKEAAKARSILSDPPPQLGAFGDSLSSPLKKSNDH